MGDYPVNPFLVLPVFVPKLGHKPGFPVQGAQKQIYGRQNVYDKQVDRHEGSQPDNDQAREQERVPYPSVNAPDIQGTCVRSLRSGKL